MHYDPAQNKFVPGFLQKLLNEEIASNIMPGLVSLLPLRF